jgi:ABC-type multidrug transport system ATPase subunit
MDAAEATNVAIFAHRLRLDVPSADGLKPLLHDISFEIPTGHFVAIVGPSGCGKSTLLKCLTGEQSPTGGRLLLGGYPVEAIKDDFPLAIGYLPQYSSAHDLLTVGEILRFGTSLRLPSSIDPTVKTGWEEHLASLAGVEGLLSQPYRTLSGGQRRRAALAEELIGDPLFLFLDELTSGLDPQADLEMMRWLRDLAHERNKTVLIVTHSVTHLHLCDSVLFLGGGRLLYQGSASGILSATGTDSIENLYTAASTGALPAVEEIAFSQDPRPQPLKTAHPPSGFRQWPVLLHRQLLLQFRDKPQLWLHLILILTFPCLVAVFATNGLPQVRDPGLNLEKNILSTLQDSLGYLRESFSAGSLISSLVMFQVILLALMGANNGAREIAKERAVLEKELRVGVSPGAYVFTKFFVLFILSAIQAFWMAGFVKWVCGFPGDFADQGLILFAHTLAVSCSCLAISAANRSPERASLLAIYLVGLQLPLSGAILALPDAVSMASRPFITSYWAWSGYLKTLESFRHYDIVQQITHTTIAPLSLDLAVLSLHILLGLGLAWFFTARGKVGTS